MSAVRYTLADYDNPGGTNFDDNTLSISLISGVSLNATLSHFLQKLGYQGDRRPWHTD